MCLPRAIVFDDFFKFRVRLVALRANPLRTRQPPVVLRKYRIHPGPIHEEGVAIAAAIEYEAHADLIGPIPQIVWIRPSLRRPD